MADGSALALNGEIYNIRELVEASSLPKPPVTDLSDSEWLALLLNHTRDHTALLRQLRGEFALAYYHSGTASLLLARDPMGCKPLFWSVYGSTCAFGSSAKAVSLLGPDPLAPDWSKVRDILEFGVTPTANVFADVESVAAGTLVKLQGNQTVSISIRPVLSRLAPLAIKARLRRAVADRVAGGRAALAFSGGVDSSLIRALAGDVPTHTIRMEGERVCGEHTVHAEPDALTAEFKRMWPVLDRPLSTLSPVAMSLLARALRIAGHENLLTGEGADELFCGYPHRVLERDEGHPVLRRHREHFDVASKLMSLDCQAPGSPALMELLTVESPERWGEFDRWVRLPQHLTLLHTDIPGLLNGIEARLPFCDLCDVDVGTDCADRVPKRSLREMLARLTGHNGLSVRKEGLFVPCSSLSNEVLVALMEDVDLPEIGSSGPSLRERARDALGKAMRAPVPLSGAVREIIARTVVQLSALPHILTAGPAPLRLPDSYTWIAPGAAPQMRARSLVVP